MWQPTSGLTLLAFFAYEKKWFSQVGVRPRRDLSSSRRADRLEAVQKVAGTPFFHDFLWI
jgi:hypothetical protein